MSYAQRAPFLGLVVLLACSSSDRITSPTAPGSPSLDMAGNPVVAQVSGGAQWIVDSGPLAGYLRKFAFIGNQRADGTASGEWQLVVGSTILHGDITCLHIESGEVSTARIGGTVTDPKFATFQAGTDIAWEAVDGGEGANAAPDETSNPVSFRNSPPGSAAAFCANGTIPDIPDNPPFSVAPITEGNVQINGE